MAPDQIEPDFRSSDRFVDRLPLAGMRRLFADWLVQRGGAAMPRRTGFDPLRFPDLISSLQLHERQADGRYFCRVSGGDIVAAFGYESTGRHLDEVVLPDHLASRVALFDEALNDALPLLYEGHLVVRARDWKQFQRLLLPYADSDGTPRFLVSVLRFERLQPIARPGGTDRHGLGRISRPGPADLAPVR